MIPPGDVTDAGVLPPLRRAVLEGRVVTFTYRKPGGVPEVRRVYPLALIHLNGAWVLGAFDPARGARRTLRLSRVGEVGVGPERFQREPGWWAGPEPQHERRDVVVRLHFSRDLAEGLRERPTVFQTTVRETGEGLDVTLRVRDERDVLPWVLSWESGVCVPEPDSLRERVRGEARRLLGHS